MVHGVGSVIVQAVVLLVAVMLGVVLGRYVRPRSVGRHGVLAPAAPGAAEAGARDSGQVATVIPGQDGSVALVSAQSRAAYAEARVDRARAWVEELQGELSRSQKTMEVMWRQLRQAEAELVWMRRQVQDLEYSKEAEMGRLESGAIAALDATIASHREQVAKLEERLRAAESAAQDHGWELTVERNRADKFRDATEQDGAGPAGRPSREDAASPGC